MKGFAWRESCQRFFQDWWRSRSWEAFWRGGPVLGAGLLLAGLVLFAEGRSSWDRSRRYLTAARRAQAAVDLETAQLYYKKALQEWPNDVVGLHEAAGVAHQLGERTRRDALLRRLDEEMRYAPAMLYRAAVILDETSDPEVAIDRAETLLARALEIDRENENEGAGKKGNAPLNSGEPAWGLQPSVDALRRTLAVCHARAGRLEEAEEHWKAMSTLGRSDRVERAMTLLEAGEKEAATEAAQDLLASWSREETGAGPIERLRERAVLQAILGEVTSVRASLKALASVPVAEDAAVQEAQEEGWAAVAIRCWQLETLSRAGAEPDLRLLEEIVRVTPTMPAVIEALLALADDGENVMGEPWGTGKGSALTGDRLKELLVEGKTPLVAHLVAALRAGGAENVHGKVAEALYPDSRTLLAKCEERRGDRTENALKE